MKRLVLIALALAAATTTANAYDYSHGYGDYGRQRRIDAREAAQAERIDRARARGELTWFERFRLRSEQARIHRMERHARRDGYIDRYEARDIERAQDRASRHIYNQSHDGQRRWWAR
jgi:hypothetical protein